MLLWLVLALGTTPASEERFELDIESFLSRKTRLDPLGGAAILESVTIEDLSDSELYTLGGYLDTLPGFRYAPALWESWPAALGINGSINLMIDGISITSPIDYGFPAGLDLFLEEFGTIETISGPAGVLWGAYSLLGTVNLNSRIEEGMTISSGLGSYDTQRTWVRWGRTAETSKWGFFAGFARERNAPQTLSQQWLAVPPYPSDQYIPGEPTSIEIEPLNEYATVSAAYERANWRFYLRVPFARERTFVSDFGSELKTSGELQTLSPLAFVSHERTLLGGSLTLMNRLAWFSVYKDDKRHLLRPSAPLPYGASTREVIHSARLSLINELSYRWSLGSYSGEILGGATGQLEQPLKSSFSSRDLDTGLLENTNPSLDHSSALTATGYIQLQGKWRRRLAAILGGRYNYGGRLFESVALGQANVAVRLVGETHLRVGITEGMRPPQLLDRQGIAPVQTSRKLAPERSTAFQAEVSWNIDGIGPTRFHGRLGAARTSTVGNIVREGISYLPYQKNAATLSGFSIDSLAIVAHNDWWEDKLKVSLMYDLNQVYDIRARSNEPNAALRNPLCLKETCGNQGPTHRARFRFQFRGSVASWSIGSRMECGGVLFRLSPQGTVPSRTDLEPQRCFVMLDAGATATVLDSAGEIRLVGQNLTDTRLAPNRFVLPELQNTEPDISVNRARRFLLMLTWNMF